ncbi:MAG: hypothetical protein LC790_03070 [Actinobacteria bacterium]|nr:hypothetical protein [Actinomycetota bacterium]
MVDLGDEGAARLAELAPALAHVGADGALADLGPVLLDEGLEDAPGGVALLARGLEVTEQPRVDQRMEGPERRGRAALGALSLRRDGRVERLATVRRCTRWRSASARIDSPSCSWSRLICSNSSTLDPIPSATSVSGSNGVGTVGSPSDGWGRLKRARWAK